MGVTVVIAQVSSLFGAERCSLQNFGRARTVPAALVADLRARLVRSEEANLLLIAAHAVGRPVSPAGTPLAPTPTL